MTEGSLVNILLFLAAGLVAWNGFLTVQLFSMRVKIAEQHYSKTEVEAIINRVIEAVAKQIKAEIAPLAFRVRAVYAHMKIPEPGTDEP